MASKHLYGIIYHRPPMSGRREEWVSSVTLSKCWSEVERAAESNRQRHWHAHQMAPVTYLAPRETDAGMVFMVSAI
jgi:hypothetical protein